MSKSVIPAHVRDWLYPVLLAAIALLGGYGFIAEDTLPLWVALAGALLGVGTATAYRPGRSPETAPDLSENGGAHADSDN
ncbi:phage holin [Flaviflexus equikiangi]|uniref:Holin n=1 Tax=Flaviflexus equikiangi TaxID=2758573 RepID=A0ABS2TFN5_9ACTO|nr:hypothetical protein [Flaviflexus equikiangi]MBM9432326.1 hypothetical protein [Flaviflexus equikiangi]